MHTRPHQGTLLLFAGLVIIFLTTAAAHAQIRVASPTRVGSSITCHVGKKVYELTPDTDRIKITGNSGEIQDIFEEVSRHSNLTSYVDIVPVLDPDVTVEICPGETNYIAYRAGWLLGLYNDTRNKWAVYAIIAHEIGHYAKGHDRNSVRSNPTIELEADKYAGEVLAKMNVSLPDAEAAFRSDYLSPRDETHPPLDKRIEAVREGWERGAGTSVVSQANPSRKHIRIDIVGEDNAVYLYSSSSPNAPTTIRSGSSSTASSKATATSTSSTSCSISDSTSGNVRRVQISGQCAEKTYYLEDGESAEVTLYGQSIEVYISSAIRDRVRIKDRGESNKIETIK